MSGGNLCDNAFSYVSALRKSIQAWLDQSWACPGRGACGVRVVVGHHVAVHAAQRTEPTPQRPPGLPDVEDLSRLDRPDPVEARPVRDIPIPPGALERHPR